MTNHGRMTARQWIRYEASGDAGFSVRATSEGRGWGGFNAALYETGSGLVEVPTAPCHNIAMHVSRPVDVLCRCDGPAQRRLQSPGDVDVVPAGCGIRWEESGPTTVLSVTLSPHMVRSTAEAMDIDPSAIAIHPILQLRDPMLQHVAWALKAELEAGEPHDRLYAESLGTALTARLLRRFAKAYVPRRGLTKRQWQAVVDYIGDNLALNHSLSDLAAVAGLGISSFKKFFRESAGMPVHQYVIRQRVEQAMRLISVGRPSLSDVAKHVGFADQSHMGRHFLRVVGMTPAAVAREYR